MGHNADRRARILLINPNSNAATTAMMVAIAKSAVSDDVDIIGATATRAPQMIVSMEALEAAAPEVEEIARAHQNSCDGIIVCAFGDPGLAGIKAASRLPARGCRRSALASPRCWRPPRTAAASASLRRPRC
jgi:Asp/Glu/hydantoin racemase